MRISNELQNQCLIPPISSWAAGRLLGVAAPLLMFLLASVSVNAQSPAVGYRDFYFGTTVNSTPTGEKPESKLWFNDGVWWGSLFNTTTSTYHIYRFNASTQSWTDTGTQLDNRPSTRADCLWDGSVQKLYVASHVFSINGTSKTGSGQWGRVYRYSYHSSTQSYTLDSGFPVTVNKGNSETLVIAKDTTGVLWVTFTQNSQVYVNHSAVGNDTDWGTPFLPPTNNSDTTLGSSSMNDISSLIAFGPGNIGVMWSNQLTMKFYFMVHKDGDPDTVWQPEETALPPAGVTGNYADGHINLKTDNTGRAFAAVKTSLTGSTDPLIELLERATDGTWSNYVFGRDADGHSRAIVQLDLEHNQLYIFAVSPEGGTTPEAIYYKTTSLNAISFPPGLGVPLIQNATDTKVNNASSTKQNVDSTTGLLVISSDANTRYYQHNFLTLTGGTQPVVSTFSPTADPPGSIITITGSGFTAANVVAFNGQAAQFTVNSDTQITATEPNGATTGPVTVSTQSGLVGTSSASFNVTGTPHISSFTPTSGPVGTVVTLNGSGFTGTTSVTFNGVSASFSFVKDSKLTAVVPAGATTGPIHVTNPAGTGTSSSNFVVTVVPVITSFTPTSGSVGTAVTITGSGFTASTKVTFNTVVASFTVNSDTQITATVPANATTGPIQVTNSAGTGTSSSNFAVTSALITSFTPTNGPVGTTLTITGSGFTGSTAVSFAGTAASFTVNSDTQITTTVPTGATTGPIQVTNPSGTATSPSNFIVTVVPVITSFTPTSGPVGTTVTITGSGFTASTKVTFNTVVASFTVNSDTQITATVPPTATTGPIQVTNSAGTGTSSSSFVVTLAQTVSFVKAAAAQNIASSGITSLSVPVSTSASDLLVAFVAEGTSSTDTMLVSDSAGNTWTNIAYDSYSATNRSGMFYSANTAAVTSITVTFSTSGGVGNAVIVVYEIAGAASSSVSDGSAVAHNATAGTSLASGSLTTTNANDIILYGIYTPTTTSAWVAGTGFSFPTGSTEGHANMDYAIVSSTQSGLSTITSWTNSSKCSSIIAAFKQAGTSITPSITSFTPMNGPVGTTVTITGSGFTGATAVNFAGTAASFTVNTDAQITATVPTGATTGAIQVTTSSGTGTSSSNFVVTVVPVVTSFTPTSGPVGTTVTITGSGFTASTKVTFNTVVASFTVNSDTQITATVPPTATTGPIQVTNSAGTGTSASNFVVTLAQTVSFVKSAAAQNTGSSGITSLSVPMNTSGNDLLVAFVAQGTSGTDTMQVSDSAGNPWTNIAYDSYSSTNRSGMFYAANAAAVTGITVTFSTSGGVGNAVIVVYEIAGAASSSVSDGSAVAHNATAGTSLASGSLTTTNANDIILYGIYTPTTTSAWVAGTGFTFPTGSTEGRANMDYAIVSSTQSGLSTITSWTNSSKCSSIIAAFK